VVHDNLPAGSAGGDIVFSIILMRDPIKNGISR